MARVTQEHVDARRRQILDAASRQFGLKGLDPGAATIDDIAADAGLSKGSIYSYFKNKDELLEAIIARAFASDAVMFASAAEQSDSSWDAFWVVCRRVWDVMSDSEGRESQMLSFERLLMQLRSKDEIDERYVEGPVGELTKMLEGAQGERRVAADLDPEVLATMLWNCQQGLRAYILRTGDTEMAESVLVLIRDLLVRTAETGPSEFAGVRV